MADMRWNFLQVYTKVAEYLGMDITDATDLAAVKDIVYRGYMKFLMPVKSFRKRILPLVRFKGHLPRLS